MPTRAAVLLTLTLACVLAAVPALAGGDDPSAGRLLAFERSIDADPENLELAAEYRALVIEAAHYDRAIDFLRRVAQRKGGGPNAYISLALAYVDKVPPAGDIRRLYLGRDAMAALTRSIALRPCALAYYMRGVINLYYNRVIFNRTDKGIADLTQALSMAAADAPPILVMRIQTALGDGYHKIGNAAKAREIWSAALSRFPDDPKLRERMAKQGQELDWAVGASLAAERRVDTSLKGVLPIR